MSTGRNDFRRGFRRKRDDDDERPSRFTNHSRGRETTESSRNSSRVDRSRYNKPKHPRHLKGKEIGLYYARKSLAEKTEESIELKKSEICKPLAKIILPENKKVEIRKLLKNTKWFNLNYLHINIECVKDSQFKTEFLKIISGTFELKLNDASLKKMSYPSDILNVGYFEKFLFNMKENPVVKEMLIARQKLPCYDKRNEILELIKNNQVVVICGETGCGKTTQVPQYILDDFILSSKGSLCNILCTQPRRISAISVAERVAEERGEKIGSPSIGYHIRLEKKLPRESGSITYCTTGILLKLMENNPSLSTISHLILDEIHERDITSDFVLTLMKMVISHRPDLKLILMSATLNAEQFSKYYNNCAIINIPGFTFPVETFYLEDALARTKYNFEPYKMQNGWRKHLKSNKSNQGKIDEFVEMVGPFVRNLQAKKKYNTQVCNNLMNPNSENKDAKFVVELIKYICNSSNDNGSILVFVPGFTDISLITKCMTDSKCFPLHKYLIINLHSKLPSIEQKKVFEKPPRGMRKIVISTNIAETSITIDDIIYVIDTGKIKMKSYNVEEDLEALQDEWVTVANANQRKGRAGRVQAGVCYHLISRARFFNLEAYPKPEVQRTRLEGIILTCKLLQLGKADTFLNQLMNPPEPKAIENGIKLLKHMNALDDGENLTPLGYHLAKLPTHPRMGKMILMGCMFSCLDPILSIAASLDFKDAFQYPVDRQQAVNEQKMKILSGWNSDHLVLAEAIRLFELAKAAGKEREFCWDHFLSRHTLDLLCKMKEQFAEYLFDMKFISNKSVKSREWNQNSRNFSLIKAIVCAGLYPNVAIIRTKNRKGIKTIRTTEYEKVVIGLSSINNLEKNFSSPILVYHLKQKLLRINLFDSTMVHPLPLLFFGDKINIEPLKTENRGKVEISKKISIIYLSNMLRFKCRNDTANLIKELRDKLDELLAYKITHPGCINWLELLNPEVKVMRAIMELITSEDLGEIDVETEDD